MAENLILMTLTADSAKEAVQAYIDALLHLFGSCEPIAVLQELPDFIDKETGGLCEKMLTTCHFSHFITSFLDLHDEGKQWKTSKVMQQRRRFCSFGVDWV